jgi:imidazolonepropionase-like amidohydrolase
MGENPKRTYGKQGKMPMTRMGSAAVMREAFTKGRSLIEARARFEQGGKKGPPPERDLVSETLADLLEGKVRAHVHGYLVEDFLTLFRIADEFGFKVASIHHALEAHRIAPEIQRRGIGVATFADLWGYKHRTGWSGARQPRGTPRCSPPRASRWRSARMTRTRRGTSPSRPASRAPTGSPRTRRCAR